MTSKELYEKLKPYKERRFTCRLLVDGLSMNLSDIFCPLIKDAARCNSYQSDVYYDLKLIESTLKEFRPEDIGFDPIWIGFRKMGVDGTRFVLTRQENDTYLTQSYFALYAITVQKRTYTYEYLKENCPDLTEEQTTKLIRESEEDDFYDVVMTEYAV